MIDEFTRRASQASASALIGCWLLTIAVDVTIAATAQIGASKDTTIFQSGVNNSAGGQTQFYSGTNTVISPRRALIEFDIVSKVPAGSFIVSADLTLTLSMVAGSGMGGGGGKPTIGLHEIAQEWGEGTVATGMGQGSAADPGDATWISRTHGSASWTNPGGDFDSISSGSLTIVGTKVGVSYTWLSTAALVADVQAWLNNASNNHGWLLLNTDESSPQTFRAFHSKESGTASFRPLLEIDYAIAGDANFDDHVDGADYTLWADHYLETGQTWGHGDFNGDGIVNGGDYTIWADHYAPALATVAPEPSTILLVGSALLSLLAGGRIRRFRRQS